MRLYELSETRGLLSWLWNGPLCSLHLVIWLPYWVRVGGIDEMIVNGLDRVNSSQIYLARSIHLFNAHNLIQGGGEFNTEFCCLTGSSRPRCV